MVESVENLFVSWITEEESVVFEVVDDERGDGSGVNDIVVVFVFAFDFKGFGAMCEEELYKFLFLEETYRRGVFWLDLLLWLICLIFLRILLTSFVSVCSAISRVRLHSLMYEAR